MCEPVSLSTITAGISTVIKIAEVTYQLRAVGEQTTDLLRTTLHVDSNIREARRLLRLKHSLLTAGERTWMDGVVTDTEDAVKAIAALIEPSRVDMVQDTGRDDSKNGEVAGKGKISMLNKAIWVFRDSPKVRDKFARLSLCHHSLGTVLACLYSRDVVVVGPVLEQTTSWGQAAEGKVGDDPPPPYDAELAELFDWRRNTRRRKTGGPSPTDALPTSPPAQNALPTVRLEGGPDVHELECSEFAKYGSIYGSRSVPSPSVSQGSLQHTYPPAAAVKRSNRRAWLAYQAMRSDLGHADGR